MTDRIVFVCTDNTTLSPMAEAIYKNLSEDSPIEAESRGRIVLFSEPVNPKAVTVMGNHNLAFDHPMSLQLKARDITETTLVLTMSEALKKQVADMFPDIRYLYSLKEYSGENGDVTDPYGGTLVDYEECYNELVRLIKKTIYRLDEERHSENKVIGVINSLIKENTYENSNRQ